LSKSRHYVVDWPGATCAPNYGAYIEFQAIICGIAPLEHDLPACRLRPCSPGQRVRIHRMNGPWLN